jgi:hypothetical protein
LLTFSKDELLQKQFDVIYDKFLPYGIEMKLAGIDHTINKEWANITALSPNEANMKASSHKHTKLFVHGMKADRDQ